MDSHPSLVMKFAITLTKGITWDAAKPRRSQTGWDEHARFMDNLTDNGFVLLGGPLGNGEDVLLIITTDDPTCIVPTLEQDPWIVSGILAIKKVQEWKILLKSPQIK